MKLIMEGWRKFLSEAKTKINPSPQAGDRVDVGEGDELGGSWLEAGTVEGVNDDGSVTVKLDNGEVLALDVKVGERILFSKYGGTDVKLDGQQYLIMREDDILGVIE